MQAPDTAGCAEIFGNSVMDGFYENYKPVKKGLRPKNGRSPVVWRLANELRNHFEEMLNQASE